MEKEEQRFVVKDFWMKDWGPKKIQDKLFAKLGNNVYGLFQIRFSLQKFREGDSFYKDLSRPA
jgi:hypothetical protein